MRLLIVAALIGAATPLSAQVSVAPQPVSSAKLAAVNVALGALTAGSWSASRKKSFWRGFARGGAGGAIVFAGKRLMGEGNPASWWVGRELAALGSSEVANASEGLAFLQRAVIPIGPIRFHLDRSAKRKIVPKLDLALSIAGVVIASRDRTRIGIQESLATGAIVFIVPENSRTVGTHTAGILSVSEGLPDGNFPPLAHKRKVISHEMVHAAQYDFMFTAWSDAAQRSIARNVPAAGLISRYIDVNLVVPFQLVANGFISYENRPWEKEAASIAKN